MTTSEQQSPAEQQLVSDLKLALKIADAAERVSMERHDTADLRIDLKADRSHVTEADLATERAIREILTAERPEDAIYGEEYGIEGDSRRQWIIDPIDGTANYMRGLPAWGNLICLAIDGVPVVSVVGMPALGRRWWAATGLGAFTRTMNGEERRLRVSTVDRLDEASVSFQSIQQWDEAGYLDALISLSRTVWRDRGYGDVWPYMLLAEGRLEFVAEFGLQEYDIAAIVPIVREAGGTITSFDGKDTISAGSTLATNTILHNEFLSLVHKNDGGHT